MPQTKKISFGRPGIGKKNISSLGWQKFYLKMDVPEGNGSVLSISDFRLPTGELLSNYSQFYFGEGILGGKNGYNQIEQGRWHTQLEIRIGQTTYYSDIADIRIDINPNSQIKDHKFSINKFAKEIKSNLTPNNFFAVNFGASCGGFPSDFYFYVNFYAKK